MTEPESVPKANRRWIAWLSTIFATVFALLPGAFAITSGRTPKYDSTLGILTATLIALVWYTQFTFETLQHARTRDRQERDRTRRVLATGLLAELEWIEGILEQIYDAGPYSSYDPLEHPLFELAISQANVFSDSTVSQMARFHALLRDLRAGVNTFRLNPEGFGKPDSPDYFKARQQFSRFMKAKAQFAVAALPALVSALQSEGGFLQQRVLLPTIDASAIPPLPPSPFGPRRKL